jgi:hypothetical protein
MESAAGHEGPRSPGLDNAIVSAIEASTLKHLRKYWPKEAPPSILNDTWSPPDVERVE